ncbi:MAG: GNAT family N-acetyltransferase, partial [Planctomycetota bacterium]
AAEGPPRGVRIRPLTPADFLSLCRYDWTPLVSERDTIYLFIAQDHARYCFAAEDERGRAIGYLVAAGSADGERAFVFHVHVRPDKRRRGIGTALVRSFEDAARTGGVRVIWLLARDRAKDFYSRLGYGPMEGFLDPAAAGYVKQAKRTGVMGKRLDAGGMKPQMNAD